MIPIGYGTYGLRDLDLLVALPRLAAIGYRALEITAAPGWSTAPANLADDDRRRIAVAIRDAGFPAPAVMALLPLCAEGAARPAMVEEFRAVCALARDLATNGGYQTTETGRRVVVTSTLAGEHSPWESNRDRIAEQLIEVATIADGYGVTLAVEPHAGGSLDTPEKAVWLMETTHHPALRLNFDISHFHLLGIEMERSFAACMPYAAHLHIKDGYMDGHGRAAFLLPGDGTLDLPRYFSLRAAYTSELPVIVEVSGMIWKRSDYDPWVAAERSYVALDQARRVFRSPDTTPGTNTRESSAAEEGSL